MSDHGVHVTHCCLRHGCKYGDEECPVANGILKQAYDCEACEMDKHEYIHMTYDDLKYMVELMTEEQRENLRMLLER